MTRTRQYRSWISAIHQNGAIRTLALGMLLAAALGAMTTAQAQTYTILYSFKGALIPDAASPQGDLIRDAKGNLYGTTALAGTSGAGAVFKLDPLGNESVRRLSAFLCDSKIWQFIAHAYPIILLRALRHALVECREC